MLIYLLLLIFRLYQFRRKIKKQSYSYALSIWKCLRK